MHFFAPDIGIDLGSCNTLIYVKKRGIVISEPTMLLVNSSNRRQVIAVGDEARHAQGRTNDARSIVRPIRNGMIADFDMTCMLLKYFIRKAIGVSNVVRPKVVISVPAGMDDVNRKAITEAVHLAGIRKVYLVEKPFAAALGSGLPVYDPVGSMVVDIGGGTTDVAVVSLGGLVVSQSIPVGGAKMDESIINHIKREFNMLIGDRTAEDVKIDLASAMPLSEDRQVQIRGRDLLSPQAMDIRYTSRQAYQAIHEPCRAIIAAIRWVLERTPPELSADIFDFGIVLVGGGSLLPGIDRAISDRTGIRVIIAKKPMEAVCRGLGRMLQSAGDFSEFVKYKVK